MARGTLLLKNELINTHFYSRCPQIISWNIYILNTVHDTIYKLQVFLDHIKKHPRLWFYHTHAQKKLHLVSNFDFNGSEVPSEHVSGFFNREKNLKLIHYWKLRFPIFWWHTSKFSWQIKIRHHIFLNKSSFLQTILP